MSIQSAKEFIEKMETDSNFASCMANAPSKEERWVIAKAEGFDFTEDDFNAVFRPYDARICTIGSATHTTREQCHPESCCS